MNFACDLTLRSLFVHLAKFSRVSLLNDVRPANGNLWGLTQQVFLYTLEPLPTNNEFK